MLFNGADNGGSSFQAYYLVCCGLFTIILSSTLRPKNSTPYCFLNGLSNPVLNFHYKSKRGIIYNLDNTSALELITVAVLFKLATSFVAACSQSYFHQLYALKTVHRTVFLTGFQIPF